MTWDKLKCSKIGSLILGLIPHRLQTWSVSSCGFSLLKFHVKNKRDREKKEEKGKQKRESEREVSYPYDCRDTGMDELQSRWLLLGYESVELVAVLVPLDRVQLLAVQIKVALEAYILPEHRVLRHYQLQHPQAVCFCNTQRRMRDQSRGAWECYACVECYANARHGGFSTRRSCLRKLN